MLVMTMAITIIYNLHNTKVQQTQVVQQPVFKKGIIKFVNTAQQFFLRHHIHVCNA